MKGKAKVLVLAPYFSPGFKAGGPVRSVVNIIEGLGSEFKFYVLTRDRDLGDAEAYPDVRQGDWHGVGCARVRYLGPGELGLKVVRCAMTEIDYDVVYLNSFFSLWSSIVPLVLRRVGLLPRKPVLLAPRGEFSQGAIALKGLKKHSYVRAARVVGLHRRLCWHATSHHEVEDIRRIIGANQGSVYVASNISTPPQARLVPGPRDGDTEFHVAFLSRISPKKNLDYALDVLRGVRVPVTFNIYGPTEDQDYWARCQEKLVQLPAHVSARYHGALAPAEVPAALRANDLFFLPTRGENFGHVIAEALRVGTPVLISDQTPWRGLAERGLGFDYGHGEREKFIEVIECFGEMAPEERMQMRLATHAAALRYWDERDDVAAHRDMFRQVIGAENG